MKQTGDGWFTTLGILLYTKINGYQTGLSPMLETHLLTTTLLTHEITSEKQVNIQTWPTKYTTLYVTF